MNKTNSGSGRKITVGIFMLLLVAIYSSDRLINHLDLRFFDWFCWAIMIISGIILIAGGIRVNKK